MDLGLAPADESWRTLSATDDFWSTFGDALEALGPYPHAEVMAAQKKTQTTRMLKLTCPLCGYTLRTSAKWIATGLPVCHDGTQFQTDEELARLAGDIATTIFHPVGTTRMGRDGDPMAVLDSQLRVRGVAGLRVVDAGAMPTITSGNTNSPVLMMAEKAASLIRAEST